MDLRSHINLHLQLIIRVYHEGLVVFISNRDKLDVLGESDAVDRLGLTLVPQVKLESGLPPFHRYRSDAANLKFWVIIDQKLVCKQAL